MSIKVEVFSAPGCGSCEQAKNVLNKVLESLNSDDFDYQEVDISKDMDRAQSVGVMSTPSIAINGKLSFTGVPGEKELKSALENKL